MTNEFSPDITSVLMKSREVAFQYKHLAVAPEHILMAVLRVHNETMRKFFAFCNCDMQHVLNDLEHIMSQLPTDEQVTIDKINFTMLANNVVRLSVVEARMSNDHTIELPHLLRAILQDANMTNVKVTLLKQNITPEHIDLYFHGHQSGNLATGEQQHPSPEAYMDNATEDDDDFFDLPSQNEKGTSQRTTRRTQKKTSTSETPVLDKFSHDLTRAAAEHQLDPVVGREREIQRVIEILGRRKKNNPILIGEPGVGKTAIVEGLAERIVQRKTSPMLYGKRVVSLDMAAVVAGTKYRGQFEERIRLLLQELENRHDIILFIDEIHTMIGAGSAAGSMDAANMLKPALARGTIQCIGSTTLDEFRNSIEKDGALDRRFQKVLVEQTSAEETLEILHNLKERYEQHHHVSYTDEALRACVELTARYITDRAFPDKAIDAMDETGSKVRLKEVAIPAEILEKEHQLQMAIESEQQAAKNQNYELAASLRDRQAELTADLSAWNRQWMEQSAEWQDTVTADDVANVVSMMSGVPVQRLAEDEGVMLRQLPERLKAAVIAQDSAIDKTVKAIQRNRLGLREANHPIGVFMFLGPTGVGKTHLAKSLAKEMFGSSDALIRIDMSEYTESFNTSRLIGAPPGYVGYEEGGQLTEQVRRKPYSIVLLDEIEKAHPNVFNMLLQVLDEGRLTDGNGRLIDFRNTVIIMTSNAGSRQLKEFGRGIGFTASAGLIADNTSRERARSIIQKALSRQFAPEFLNRLDDIITFDQLDIEAIKKIVDIELRNLYERVESLGFHLSVSDKAKEFIATQGYDIQFGARPLKRALQTYLEDSVCERLLSGELSQGDTIQVKAHPSKQELTFAVVKPSQDNS